MLKIVKDCYCSKTTYPFQALERLKVLVVDDNLDSLDLISFILETYDIEVQAELSALSALEVIDKFQPHILVSDIAMPEVDGYSLISTIRQSKSLHKDIPAIAITAMSTEDVFNLTVKAGFQACLIKPFEPDKLVELITSLHLKRKRIVSKISAA